MIFLILFSNIPNSFARDEGGKCVVIYSLIDNFLEPFVDLTIKKSTLKEDNFKLFVQRSDEGLRSSTATPEDKQKIALLNLILLSQAKDIFLDVQTKNELKNIISIFKDENDLKKALENYVKRVTKENTLKFLEQKKIKKVFLIFTILKLKK